MSEDTVDVLRRSGLYFFFPVADEFYYLSDCLSQGFSELGVSCFANIDRKGFIGLNESDFNQHLQTAPYCVLDITAFERLRTERDRVANLLRMLEARTSGLIVISNSDVNTTLKIADKFPLFVTHENRFRTVPGNRIPWAFGLSNEMIRNLSRHPDFERRKPVFLRNFRPSLNQSVRDSLDLSFVPILEKHFALDRSIDEDDGRFQESYYARLLSSLGCLAYGGHYIADMTSRANNPILRMQLFPAEFHQDPVIVRWDSWRFWEALAAGCITLHLDFELYGFDLPVQPKNWVHYIGIDLTDPKSTVERLLDERDRLPEIAAAGHRFALDEYGPRPVAERFLSHLGTPGKAS